MIRALWAWVWRERTRPALAPLHRLLGHPSDRCEPWADPKGPDGMVALDGGEGSEGVDYGDPRFRWGTLCARCGARFLDGGPQRTRRTVRFELGCLVEEWRHRREGCAEPSPGMWRTASARVHGAYRNGVDPLRRS